jgi:hypothetical protein
MPGGVWKESILYRFMGGADGATPQSSLVFDSAGNLYGTAVNGGNFDGACGESDPDYGCGVVFELSPQAGGGWTERVIYSFTGLGDGAYPAANVTFDSAGNLYGTTQLGGQCQSDCGGVYGYGTVFELTPNGSPTWSEMTLYAFQGGPDGGVPLAGLTFDQQGNIYGTNSLGAIFQLAPRSGQGQSWTFSTIGYGGPGGLTFDSAGTLYGASSGKPGFAYELSPSGNGGWKQSTLYTFNSRNYDPVGGVVFDSKGHMYGSLEGTSCGGLYRLEDIKGAWTEAEMDFYTGHSGPCGPEATPIFGKWGAAYGTSVEGGSCPNGKICGTVFGILP